ncbi:MAG TPA: tRNA (adenosine(37)-N6)-threonylcarbamoyltransferase complex ATPase subunit type 1 TsaE [Bacillota bacterium]|nr:tRNA (adenosine(37)-N6)-threonylcarbamoyltransferase complex ATPase subunit type 1 TsaE [Bacillota bacterium]
MRQGEAFLTTRATEETEYIGAVLGKAMRPPLVVALYGDLGTGKTVLVRGAARAMGIEEEISSPSFVLLKIYQGRFPLYHYDFYRLNQAEELEELGIDEYLPGEGVAFVEWAGRFPEYLPQELLDVTITRFFDYSGEGRRIHFVPHGPQASQVVEKLIETITWRVDGTLNRLPLTEEINGASSFREGE